jgi:putative tryptophan/tyrosine transport system substrate-binding protein
MRRRNFITLLGGAAVWPIAARAQQGERMRRIGVLMPLAESDPEVRSSIDALRRGLLEFGWREEHNLKVDYRFVAEASALKSAAAELVALAPDVIVCRATPATTALKTATAKIPIVFTVVVDPVSSVLVQSWARPGGNITGFANFEPSMVGKWLEVLKEAAPGITRAAILFNPNTAPNRGATFLEPFAAAGFGLRVEVNGAAFENEADLEPIFAKLARQASAGLIAMPDLLPVQQPSKFEMVINLKTAKALGLEIPPTLLARADEVIE